MNKNPIITITPIKSTKDTTSGVVPFLEEIYNQHKDIHFQENYLFESSKNKADLPNVDYQKNITFTYRQFNKKYKNSWGETFIFNSEIFALFFVNKKIIRNNDFIVIDHGQRYKIFSMWKYRRNPLKKYYFMAMRFTLSPFIGMKTKNAILVTFSPEDKEILEGKRSEFRQVKYIRHSVEDYSNGVKSWDSKTNDLLYIGDVKKNNRVEHVLKIAIKNNLKVKIGCNDNTRIVNTKFDNSVFIDQINEQKKNDLYSSSKYFVMLSRYESFPNSLIESLMNGVPIVVLNSFPAAKYLVGKENQRGYLAKSISDAENWIRKNINNKEEWEQKSYLARQFYLNELSYDLFKQKWNEIIGYKKFQMNSEFKLLSIVIPCYGKRDEIVRESLKSVQEAVKNYFNIEAILVYKNGPNFNYNWIKEEFPEINVIHTEKTELKRIGKIAIGSKIAKGKYLYFFDPDDYVNHKDLNNFLKELYKHEEEILITDFLMKVRKNKEPLYRQMSNVKDEVILKWFTNFPGNYCSFFKREHFLKCVDSMKQDTILNNDLYIILMAMNHFAKFGFIRLPFLIYMRVKGNIGESDFAKYLTKEYIQTCEDQLFDVMFNTKVNYADFNARRIANKLIQIMINGWHIALMLNTNWNEAFRRSNIMLQKLHFHRIIEYHQLYKTINYLCIPSYPYFRRVYRKSLKNKK